MLSKSRIRKRPIDNEELHDFLEGNNKNLFNIVNSSKVNGEEAENILQKFIRKELKLETVKKQTKAKKHTNNAKKINAELINKIIHKNPLIIKPNVFSQITKTNYKIESLFQNNCKIDKNDEKINHSHKLSSILSANKKLNPDYIIKLNESEDKALLDSKYFLKSIEEETAKVENAFKDIQNNIKTNKRRNGKKC